MLPGGSGGQPSNASLFHLAPNGVCHATNVTDGRVISSPTISPLPLVSLTQGATGGIFSAALSLGSPPPAVDWHSVLWSPDFPPAQMSRRSPGSLRRRTHRHRS